MHVVALAVQLYQLGLEVGADLGEDSSECFDSLAIKAAVAAFGDKDQMDVHCRSAVSAVSKVLDFVHGPDNNESMERRQAFRFQLMPNGEQQRQMRRFAGCARGTSGRQSTNNKKHSAFVRGNEFQTPPRANSSVIGKQEISART